MEDIHELSGTPAEFYLMMCREANARLLKTGNREDALEAAKWEKSYYLEVCGAE